MTRPLAFASLLALVACNELLGIEERHLVEGGSPSGGSGAGAPAGGAPVGGAGGGGSGEGGSGEGGMHDCAWLECSPGCVDLFTSEDHCGLCGQLCVAPAGCLAGACDRRLRTGPGSATTCARISSGLVCWGANDFGQAGNGVATPGQAQPASLVTALPERATTLFASAGPRSTCAITAEGRVLCFGKNEDGSLGISQTGGPDDSGADTGCCHYVDAVEPELPEVEVLDVASGGFGGREEFHCALTAGGEVYCWGNDAPVPIKKLEDATQIEVGASEACALRSDGEVWCWSAPSPAANDVALGEPHALDDLPIIRSLGHSLFNGFAVSHENEVFAWGRAEHGLLGPGIEIEDQEYASPVDFAYAFTSEVKQIVGGERFACAVLVFGDVLCWGENGSQGDGTPADGEFDSTPRAATLRFALEIGASATEMVARLNEDELVRWSTNDLVPAPIVLP